ncbi:HDOD domain-containing protein [Hahella aquimaris]|uniref:HDOD domain-containing protein n=1 Tax=Hahella sp. HNIBRBA332 TaxID=3015983 RepID=UPI00273C76A6|nr:HDOD domain-containing protein [Hahella sp. HNIBRBA332]WLQ14523.1 HDOD domain-containing protein [Hahella sp. HNIBRBA332]
MQDTAPPQQSMAWVDQLVKKPLPPVTATNKILLGLLSKSSLSYQGMSDFIKNDPVLALTVLGKANVAIRSDESLVKTLAHAISLLGVEFLEKLLKETPPPEPDKEESVRRYHQSIATSFFAGHLASYIAAHKHKGKEEEYFWGGLFWGAPNWYLWRFTPKKMQAWTQRLEHSSTHRRSVEEKVFGAPFIKVWSKIQEAFALPQTAVDEHYLHDLPLMKQLVRISRRYKSAGSGDLSEDRDLRLFVNKPEFIVGLSNLIAFHAQLDWRSSTFNRLCKVLAVYLNSSHSEVIRQTHLIAVESARLHPLASGNRLAESLLWDPKLPVRQEEDAAPVVVPSPVQEPKPTPRKEPETVAPSPPLVEEDDAEESFIHAQAKPRGKTVQPPRQTAQADIRKLRHGNRDLYAELTNMMLQSPHQFKDIAFLMNNAARCVKYGVGLHTCVIALINTKRTRLKGYYAVGAENRPDLPRLDLDLTEASLFSKLMEKPSSLWVKPGSSPKVKAMIPESFKALNKMDDFFLMSLFVKTRPVALFYADAGLDSLPLSEYEYESFKHVCSSASHVLHHFAVRNQQNKNQES